MVTAVVVTATGFLWLGQSRTSHAPSTPGANTTSSTGHERPQSVPDATALPAEDRSSRSGVVAATDSGVDYGKSPEPASATETPPADHLDVAVSAYERLLEDPWSLTSEQSVAASLALRTCRQIPKTEAAYYQWALQNRPYDTTADALYTHCRNVVTSTETIALLHPLLDEFAAGGHVASVREFVDWSHEPESVFSADQAQQHVDALMASNDPATSLHGAQLHGRLHPNNPIETYAAQALTIERLRQVSPDSPDLEGHIHALSNLQADMSGSEYERALQRLGELKRRVTPIPGGTGG